MFQKLDTIKQFAVNYLNQLEGAFGVPHMETTLNFAREIALQENVSICECEIAAILHDISLAEKMDFEHESIGDNHGIASAALTRKYLKAMLLEEDAIQAICDAIATHCFPNTQKTLIAKVLWDADKLNMFAAEMEPEYTQYWISQGLSPAQVKQRFKDYRAFYLKMLHTQTAKRIAAGLEK